TAERFGGLEIDVKLDFGYLLDRLSWRGLPPLRSGRRRCQPDGVMDTTDIILRAALVGIGGTIVLDLYALLMQRMFGVPAGNWKLVGRWLGHMSKCEFVQTNIGQAEPVPGEHALGWTFHYVIGIAYGLLLVAIWGAGWLRQPGIAEPLILAIALLV